MRAAIKIRHSSVVALLALLAASPVPARDQDSVQATQVKADSIEVNQQTGVTTYLGNVSFKQADIAIAADKVEVRQREEAVQSLTAYGSPVRFRQGVPSGADIHGQAKRVDYFAADNKITLRGQVHLQQGDDVFEAETVHYLLDRSRVTAEGDPAQGGVTSVLSPRRFPRAGAAP